MSEQLRLKNPSKVTHIYLRTVLTKIVKSIPKGFFIEVFKVICS